MKTVQDLLATLEEVVKKLGTTRSSFTREALSVAFCPGKLGLEKKEMNARKQPRG